MHDPIAMELDEDGKWVVFRRTHREQGGDFARGLLEIPPRYTLADVSAAALATGLVVGGNDGFLLDATTGCNALASYIDRLFGYFDKPGKPGAELRRIIEQVRERFEVDVDLPPWSFAWLDLIVRDDLADAARSEADPWSGDEVTLDLAKVRDRRLEQVLQTHRQLAAPGELKQAKSRRTRTGKTKRQDKTG